MSGLPPARPRSIDEKLARGLVRQEMRRLCPDGLDPTLKSWFEDALDALGKPISSRGRIEMPPAAVATRRFEAAAAKEPRVLLMERRTSGKTLSRRHAFEEFGVTAYRKLSGHEEFGGTSLHLLVRPRELTVCIRPLPFTFIPHLPERLLNRKGDVGDDWNAPARIVSRGLMDVLPLFCLFARPAALLPERRLSLPLGPGLALGTVDASDQWDFTIRVREGGMEDVENIYARFLLTPAGGSQRADAPLIYRGKTYVPPAMLGDDQLRLRARLLDMLERLGPAAAAYRRLALWPHCSDRESFSDPDDPRVAAFHRLSEEAAELLSQDWAVRAMGGSGPAPGEPLKPDTPITHVERMAAEEAQWELGRALRMARGLA